MRGEDIVKRKMMLCLWLLLLASCGEEQPTYEEQFELRRFRVEHYDLHNPILNTFALDSLARTKHPDYYVYDAYFDEHDTLRYAFFRCDSYGFLFEFHYSVEGKVQWARIYPILTSWVDEGAEINYLSYFYKDGSLVVIKDTLNDELIFVDSMTATVYKGLLESGGTDSLDVRQIPIEDYYVTELR
jgi:hypothetical protein